MFRLVRWAFWLVAMAAVGWFATTVPLGSRTLLGHLLAIAGTPEAKELGRGVEEAAKDATDRARQTLREQKAAAQQVSGEPAPLAQPGTLAPAPRPAVDPPAAPTDRLDGQDRRALDELVRERTQTPATR